MGLSRREFAKAEGCSEGAVRNALRQKRLSLRPDGTLDPSQLGRRWMRNLPAVAKGRVKRETSTAQVAHTVRIVRGEVTFGELGKKFDRLADRLFEMTEKDDLDLDLLSLHVALYYMLLFNASLIGGSPCEAGEMEITKGTWDNSVVLAFHAATERGNLGVINSLMRGQLGAAQMEINGSAAS